MSEIVIRKDQNKWGAFYNDKRIAASDCRACVVNAVLSVTKKSSKYKLITVLNEDGTEYRRLATGV